MAVAMIVVDTLCAVPFRSVDALPHSWCRCLAPRVVKEFFLDSRVACWQVCLCGVLNVRAFCGSLLPRLRHRDGNRRQHQERHFLIAFASRCTFQTYCQWLARIMVHNAVKGYQCFCGFANKVPGNRPPASQPEMHIYSLRDDGEPAGGRTVFPRFLPAETSTSSAWTSASMRGGIPVWLVPRLLDGYAIPKTDEAP
jgi:hypothetical protein